MAEEYGACDVCQKPANQKCGGCHNVFYCSKEHQRGAWKSHKSVCKPFKIQKDEQLGRYLVANKRIIAGSIILREPPLLWGPSQITVPLCLGCGKVVTENNSRPCSKCGWPMCSEICEKAPCHIPECRYTIQRGDKVTISNFGIHHPTYQCITVLRCLYQRQFLPEVWKKLDKLESHCTERKGTPKYEDEKVSISGFIRRFFKLEGVFTEDEIMRVCGIVMINGHEVPLSDAPYVSIYEITSMFEHNCRPNCSKSFTNDGHILIVAGEDIEPGSHLSICYTDPLWGTSNRRHHLYETKFFWCSCQRCSDPSEFTTYFSAVKCQDKECAGNMLPKTFLEDTRHGKTSNWFCKKCNKSVSSYSVLDVLEKLGVDLIELEKGNSKVCKNFIKNCEQYLPPNHYYLTDVKYVLSQLIGQEFEGGLPNVPDEDLELKGKLCLELFDLSTTLFPAEKRMRGLLLFELHASLSEIGRRRAVNFGEHDLMHRMLLEAKKYLTQCVELLKNEPSVLPEGKICKQAKQNLKDLDIVLRTVHTRLLGDPLL